jgi:hypothetical protein
MSVPGIQAGVRLRSAVSETEVVVVRAPSGPVVLACGGQPLVALDTAVQTQDDLDGQTILGKRYVDEETNVELLCTKAGAGVLTADDRELTIKGAKMLPSSD